MRISSLLCLPVLAAGLGLSGCAARSEQAADESGADPVIEQQAEAEAEAATREEIDPWNWTRDERIPADFDFADYADEPAVRGVWITNVDSEVLQSRESIAEMMEKLAEANFNVVYPVVWNKAMTLYRSDVIPRYFGENQPEKGDIAMDDWLWDRIMEAHRIGIDPIYGDRDPLEELIVEAHRHGIEVIPWFEFGFAVSYNGDGGPILAKYPEWKAIDPDGNLVKKNNFEWMNAFHPDVQQFITEMVLEVVEKYDVDGIQGDDRMPALPTLGGYDDYTAAQYKAEFGVDPPRDIKDPEWVRWRAEILNDWLADLRSRVKAVDEDLTISMAPSYYDWSLTEYLQDSYSWTNRGLVESLHPQAYRYDFPAYTKIIDDLVTNQFTPQQMDLLSPGVLLNLGTYTMDTNFFRNTIAYNRINGIMGEVYFFYEGLPRDNWLRQEILAKEIYTEPVRLPYRESIDSWRPGAVMVPVSEARFNEGWAPLPTDSRFRGYTGTTKGRGIYEAEVPQDGVYDIYMLMPEGEPDFAKNATFMMPQLQVDFSVPPEQRNDDIQLGDKAIGKMEMADQSATPYEKWVHLGQVDVDGGKRYTALSLLTNEIEENITTVAGPMMMLINRKAMRE